MRSQSCPHNNFPTAPPVDHAIAAYADRQHGLISTAQLHAAGLDNAQITRRVQAGRLHRRGRGVYSLGPLSRQGEFLAAVLAAGPGALLSHWSAAELLKVTDRRAARIDVVAPRKRRSPEGARFHRGTIHPRDRTDRQRIPVTMVHRLLVDLTDAVTIPDEITAVIRQAAYLGLYSLLATQDAMERANGRKLSVLRDAIALYEAGSAGTRSGEEVKVVVLLTAQGLPRPLVNTKLLGEEVDFHWPDRKLVVELDGPHHGQAPVGRDDARRDHLLREAGWNVIRVAEPHEVVEAARCRMTVR